MEKNPLSQFGVEVRASETLKLRSNGNRFEAFGMLAYSAQSAWSEQLFILVIHLLQLMWVHVDIHLDGPRAINSGAAVFAIAILHVLLQHLTRITHNR